MSDNVTQIVVRTSDGRAKYFYVEPDFAGPITEIASGLQRATASARSGTPYKDRDTGQFLAVAAGAARRFADALQNRANDHTRWYENRPFDR